MGLQLPTSYVRISQTGEHSCTLRTQDGPLSRPRQGSPEQELRMPLMRARQPHQLSAKAVYIIHVLVVALLK